MGLIYRTSSLANVGASSIKNAALTYEEGDGNIAFLLTNLSGSNTIQGTTTINGPVQMNGTVQMEGLVYATNLTSTSQNNVLTFDSSSGQFYYAASSSIVPDNAISASYARTASYVESANIALNTPDRSILFTSGGAVAGQVEDFLDIRSFKYTNEGAVRLGAGDSTVLPAPNSLIVAASDHPSEGTYTGTGSLSVGTNNRGFSIGSTTLGRLLIACGSYQTVVGAPNNPSTDQYAFIIGNGRPISSLGATRSNLVYASGSQFQVSGSLTVTGSAFIQGLSSASQASLLTYDSSTGQVFFTASSAIGGTTVNTGSLLTTASVNLNTITFTKGDGSTFPITVNTGSGGGSGLSGGTQYYVPVWTSATTLGTSSLYESGSVLKTINNGGDRGLKLDFANSKYQFGQITGGNNLFLNLDDVNGELNLIDINGTQGLNVAIGSNVYEFGDLMNDLAFRISGGPLLIRTTYQGNDTGLILDFANSTYQFGQLTGGNTTQLIIDDGNNTLYTRNIGSDLGILFDYSISLYKFGQLTGGNQTYLTIDDATQVIKTTSGSTDVGLKLDFASNIFELGDSVINNNFVRVNNTNSTPSIDIQSEAIGIGDVYALTNETWILINNNTQEIKTINQGNDIGLKLDFVSASYSIGDFDNVSGSTKLVVDDNARRVTISGSTVLSGSLSIRNLTTGSTSNVLTYNTTTGQVFFTASSAIGGGGGGTPGGSDTQIQFNSGSTFSGSAAFRFIYASQSLEQGENVQAKGLYSFAQGGGPFSFFPTIASGSKSHAEGSRTLAQGDYSHAEGDTTQARGAGSHAEGNQTEAIGNWSHAEGASTRAIGDYSHAAGFVTVASGAYQSVIGQYNISSSAQSAFIIGNGTSNSTRSNLLFASGSQVQITGSLDVSGSGRFTNGLTVTGSATINDILVLTPRTTTPNNPASGSIIVSGSGATIRPYFWDGNTWTQMFT